MEHRTPWLKKRQRKNPGTRVNRGANGKVRFKRDRDFSTARLASVYRRDPTESEKRFKKALKRLAPLQFEYSHAIGPYIADFYCAKIRTIVELDGQYHQEPAQCERDQRRDQYFKERGMRTIRIPSHLVMVDLPGALKALKHRLSIEKPPSPLQNGVPFNLGEPQKISDLGEPPEWATEDVPW